MARGLRPNSTQIPDVILDFWLSELSGAELKVVFYIARRTYGFGKESDNISLTQICNGIKKRDGTVLDTGTGLSRSSVARAVKTLEEQGIILRKVNLSETSNEHEESTYSLNLDWQPQSGSGGEGKVVLKSNHPVSKREERWSQNRTTRGPEMKPGVVPKSNPQETDQETVLQETATAPDKPAGSDTETAVAELVQELVSHDLNRIDAIRFAREKPEECRRQAEYMAFLVQKRFQFRRGKGAYLRRAIENGFAPPAGYAEATKSQSLQAQEMARKRAIKRDSASKWNRLRETMARLEIEHPGAFMDFLAYFETKKQEAISRPILNGAPEVKERLLKTFDTEGNRLALLADYFQQNRCPVPEFQQWLSSQPTGVSSTAL